MVDKAQLAQHDNESDSMYIAYHGVVYDVSACPHWRSGLHQDQHFPGQDLSGELGNAPHGEEVFRHPTIVVVGKLEP